MDRSKCTQETFLLDVKDHNLAILKDDGLYRHLRLRRLQSQTYWYDIVTWPGYLTILGDMGCYTFARTEDMFGFFIMDDGDFNKDKKKKININPSYWSEKVQANSIHGGIREYSEESFRDAVKEHYNSWFYDYDEKGSVDKGKCWEEIEDSVLAYADVGYEALRAAHDFNFGNFSFENFGEYTVTEFTYHYIWCLHAIVHGIQEYNEAKKEVQSE
jgi:hypothetical protein